MDQSPGVKFGDLKKEERYKKLERNLKLAFVKQMERAKAYIDKGGYCTSPTWPSLSSINADALDTTSCGNPSLQVSRVESEVVSSSVNLHKVLKRHISAPMATSSVKKFPISDFDRDRVIMPPPPPVGANYRHPKATLDADSKHGAQAQHNKRAELESRSLESSIVLSSNNSIYLDSGEAGSTKHYGQDSREPRVFQRWRVLLNDQGQLIIKGTLADCGKVARSKPVIQRISSNQVQSVYKHIYVLDGNIVDERNELPDYVRGKFHNGFPDDWENVYQLWRNYMGQGCKVTFRWPTPVTDSDDDLVTEITDFTYFKNKETIHLSNSVPINATSSGYHSKSQSDSIQNLDKLNQEQVTSKALEIEAPNKKVEDSGHNYEVKEAANGSQEHNDNSHAKESLNSSINCSNLKYSSYLYEILQEDKLRVIRSNLADKNCPPQYLDKFIELIHCLRYLLSFTPNTEADGQNCLKCSNTMSFSESQELNPEEQANNSRNKTESAKHEHSRERPDQHVDQSKNPQTNEAGNKNPKTANHDTEIVVSDSSDSDTYMGIPNLPRHRVFKARTRSERYRDVKNRIKEKNQRDKTPEQHQQQQQQQELASTAQDQRLQSQNDSSVSITEDEYDLRKLKKQNKQSNDRFLPIKPGHVQMNPVNENIKYNNNNRRSTVTTDVESLATDNMTCKSTPKKRVMERSKPIVKSNELVNIDLKVKGLFKNAMPAHSDVSILDDEVSAKRLKLSHVDNNKMGTNNDAIDDKLTDDVLHHRFLTYDSEDFPDVDDEPPVQKQALPSATRSNLENKNSATVEKNQSDSRRVLQESPGKSNKLTSKEEQEKKSTPLTRKKKTSAAKDKVLKSEPFGSKENPKLLTAWMPCVTYEDESEKKCSLAFEGKLLNEAGHILQRKFVTNSILKRHSPTLVETVKNEYFMLVGEVSDTKHAVPKELLKLCRTGCPAKIKEFCDEWKNLKSVLEKSSKRGNLNNTSIDVLPVPTSSRGRKQLPPLKYWEGERIVTNEMVSVYQPGDVMETSLVRFETPKKILPSNKKPQNKKETNTKSSSRKSSEKPKVKSENSTKKSNKRIAQSLKSSDSESSEADKKELSTKKKPNVFLTKTQASEQKPKPRKRQKPEVKQSVQQSSETHNAKTRSRRTGSNVMWSLEKKQDLLDVLSDDQSSFTCK